MTDYIMKKKRTNYKRKRGPVQAKKVTYDGIKFASGLERYMYQALKKAKIKAKYEGKTYEIVSGFDFIHPSFERTANGKGEFKQRGGKVKARNYFISFTFVFSFDFSFFKSLIHITLKT